MYVVYKVEKKIIWFLFYGNEMRGGSVNCNVVVSDEKIVNFCVKNLDILLGMNSVLVDKYESLMKKNGYMFVNELLVSKDRKYREDINVIKVFVIEIV